MEDICRGCGEKLDACICEELDANANEGKYHDDDPLDGDYKINGSAPVGAENRLKCRVYRTTVTADGYE